MDYQFQSQSVAQRRRDIRQALEASGFAVYGRPITIDGEPVVIRVVKPLESEARDES